MYNIIIGFQDETVKQYKNVKRYEYLDKSDMYLLEFAISNNKNECLEFARISRRDIKYMESYKIIN